MVIVMKGAVKFKSLKAAYESAKKLNPELKYMTFYMRQREAAKDGGLGWKVSEAYHAKPRKYVRKSEQAVV